MRYDFYDTKRIYKPKLAARCRDILHEKVLRGLDVQSVCEIGVGFGEFARYCRRSGLGYVGLEHNDALRQALEEDGFRCLPATLPAFPPLEEPFDAIFASHVIEHMQGLDEALAFLEACRQRLAERNGRYLILLYPDVERCGHLFWSDYTHGFPTTMNRIEEMLLDNGWGVERSGRYTAFIMRGSRLISLAGRVFPFFLFPRRVAHFLRLSFQQHAFTVAVPVRDASKNENVT